MPLAGFTSFRGSKTTRKIMRVNNFAIFCEFDRAPTPVAPRVSLCRRPPRSAPALASPSLNLFLVAMAFFIASFVAGDTRVLAATVKLGMGYDKSDIRFVIHFQLPQNLIAYYQQIGRAGRDGKPAYALLLHGEEDEEIPTHFIATAQASPNLLKDIVGMARSGVRYGEMLKALNVKGASSMRPEVPSCPRLPVSGRIRLSCKLREGVRRGGGAGEAGPDHQDANRRARGAYRVPRFDRLLHEARGSRARCPRCARDVRHLRELPGRFHRARKRRSEHRGGSDSVLRRTTWWILGGPLPSLQLSCWKLALRAFILLR